MPGVSKTDAKYDDYGPVAEWRGEVSGYAIEFTVFKQDIDSAPMLKGLPGDRCTCPHWGYVLSGQVTFTTDNGEETYGPGDAFYVPPGHLQRAVAGTEYLSFSPADELRPVEETIMRNMAAMR